MNVATFPFNTEKKYIWSTWEVEHGKVEINSFWDKSQCSENSYSILLKFHTWIENVLLKIQEKKCTVIWTLTDYMACIRQCPRYISFILLFEATVWIIISALHMRIPKLV